MPFIFCSMTQLMSFLIFIPYLSFSMFLSSHLSENQVFPFPLPKLLRQPVDSPAAPSASSPVLFTAVLLLPLVARKPLMSETIILTLSEMRKMTLPLSS